MPELLLYLYKCEKINGLPIEVQRETTSIYCNIIVEADIPILRSDNRVNVEGLTDEARQYLNELGL